MHQARSPKKNTTREKAAKEGEKNGRRRWKIWGTLATIRGPAQQILILALLLLLHVHLFLFFLLFFLFFLLFLFLLLVVMQTKLAQNFVRAFAERWPAPLEHPERVVIASDQHQTRYPTKTSANHERKLRGASCLEQIERG